LRQLREVTELRGGHGKRLRVGDFRILFEETATEIIVSDIGPRGTIYKGKKVTPMTTEFITTPGGEKLTILPPEEYEDMRDALVHRRAMSGYRAGALTLDEVQALLTAPTPLAFWRAKRGMTQAALAKSAGTTQRHVADLESGKHGGSLEIIARIAAALDISVDSLVATN
jgi:DNA-binding XRE family transcriptional regulator